MGVCRCGHCFLPKIYLDWIWCLERTVSLSQLCNVQYGTMNFKESFKNKYHRTENKQIRAHTYSQCHYPCVDRTRVRYAFSFGCHSNSLDFPFFCCLHFVNPSKFIVRLWLLLILTFLPFYCDRFSISTCAYHIFRLIVCCYCVVTVLLFSSFLDTPKKAKRKREQTMFTAKSTGCV